MPCLLLKSERGWDQERARDVLQRSGRCAVPALQTTAPS